MKRSIILSSVLIITGFGYAQQTPTGNPPGGNTNNLARSAWYRGGNFPVGGNPADANKFGTNWNSPIYTITNGTYRSKLNGNLNYNVNGYSGVRDGYMLLGYAGNLSGGAGTNTLYTGAGGNYGAFSLLHLNGRDGQFVQNGGYRPWMKTGITFTDNTDLSYMGLRQVDGTDDLTETVIAWSENATNVSGPDDMVFRFTAFSGPNNYSNNYQSITDLDGLNVARYAPTGEYALGPVFGVETPNSPAYFRPTSLQHMAMDRSKDVWLQQTNVSGTGMGRQGNTYNGNYDGHRIGLERKPYFQGDTNTYAFYRWQENTAMIFQTDWNNSKGGTPNGERLRITSVGALSNSPDQEYQGINGPNNTTRIAMSHSGNEPITRPMSLLHLGYNTGANSFPAGSTDGWRNWMDIGTFISDGTDNMYVGLKSEGSDRADAVINWGDNQTPGSSPNGPDNLRFIFTSTTTALTGQGDSISQSTNGLELGRFYPDFNRTFPDFGDSTYGRFGVGDFTASGVNEDPTHKLDVIGNGRFRYLPDSIFQADSAVNKIVMVDSNGLLRWGNGNFIGDYCSNAPVAPLLDDYLINLGDRSYNFITPFQGRVNIGQVFCGLNADARVYIRNNNTYSTGIFSESYQPGGIGGSFGGSKYGIYAEAAGNIGVPVPPLGNYAGYFNGDVHVTGTVYLANPAVVSDQMFKQNVDSVANAMDIISQLNPVTYTYDTSFNGRMSFADGIQYGFIAQEVETILPTLISEGQLAETKDSLGNIIHAALNYKAVNYNALFAILTKGIQEQQATISNQDSLINSQDSTIRDLNDRLTSLENCLSGVLPFLCELNNTTIEQNDEATQNAIVKELAIELNNAQTIILGQNVPNPFAEQTVIEYSIPAAIQKAQILFYDVRGQLINSVDIEEMGNGRLTVFGSDLSTGTYTYTLVADGQVISTKKMVKTN